MLHFLGGWSESDSQENMADFAAPQHSKKQVVEAGKLLKGHISTANNEAVEAFKIAHHWRACHVLPMYHLRMELAGKVKRLGTKALTAARLKRMVSIRAKLRRAPHTLYQMQDIAGCRAIMDDQKAVDDLIALYRSDARHTFIDEDDYIASPRLTGYRSRHLVFRYHGRGQFAALNSNPQFVEVQIRTKLQHAWATAVEAVGMVRGEDLKSGRGNADWLRFFALMASEMAAEEGGVVVPNTPASEDDRRKEIASLNKSLHALESLESYRKALKITENVYTASSSFLIQFDRQANLVTVQGVSQKSSALRLDEAERAAKLDSVLVAVDQVGDLRAAYPNYFMDVGIFSDRLRKVIRPKKSHFFDADWLRVWINRGS